MWDVCVCAPHPEICIEVKEQMLDLQIQGRVAVLYSIQMPYARKHLQDTDTLLSYVLPPASGRSLCDWKLDVDGPMA